jgi:16S rRNA (guanine966-N2)-methyltransferase
VRVIAGTARGRRLRPPTGPRLRPTGDKVKGAIFSLLEALAYKGGFEPEVDDGGRQRFAAARAWPRVLDLYSGSGALGIEALSRGAEQAVLVEPNPQARKLIETNLRLTDLAERAVVERLTAAQAISTLPGSYDLILADPPYGDSEAAQVLASIAASPRLADGGVLVWEHRADHRPPLQLGRLRLRHTRRHGIAALSLYAPETHSTRQLEGTGAEDTSTSAARGGADGAG